MNDLLLTMGNKNYSSWSLRPWVLMKHLGLPFEERVLQLDTAQFAQEIAALSPTRRVPILRHGALLVWDSLAICEYACELAGAGWPEDREARAVARSACAEMHSGFEALRSQWPMNARATGRRTPSDAARAVDIARIDQLWTDCRTRFGVRGPWLFGDYSVADAMYAPVVLRFRSYGAQLGETAAAYVSTALADTHLQSWVAAAVAEPWTIGYSEIGM
jgi:glutathione S-transferase